MIDLQFSKAQFRDFNPFWLKNATFEKIIFAVNRFLRPQFSLADRKIELSKIHVILFFQNFIKILTIYAIAPVRLAAVLTALESAADKSNARHVEPILFESYRLRLDSFCEIILTVLFFCCSFPSKSATDDSTQLHDASSTVSA